jgi:hypothetical protein
VFANFLHFPSHRHRISSLSLQDYFIFSVPYSHREKKSLGISAHCRAANHPEGVSFSLAPSACTESIKKEVAETLLHIRDLKQEEKLRKNKREEGH